MRHFVLLAASFTVAALQAADPTLLNLVMPDAKVLAGINVQKAKTTQFGQFLLTQMPAGDSINGFISATGFDPRQDLTEVLMASNGVAKSAGLILARGTFNPSLISAAVEKDGKHSAQSYKGAQLITTNAANDDGAVAFLSGNIAIVGDLASVKGAIDRSSGNNALDPALAAKVASYAATDVWSVSMTSINFPGTEGNAANNPFGGALKSIQQASGSIMLSEPIQITAEALADNDQDATSLSDVLKFVVMMVAGQNSSTASLLNSLNVSTDHSTINIKFSIPEDQLEQLIKSTTSDSEKTAKKRIAAHV